MVWKYERARDVFGIGASINSTNKDGLNALLCAAQSGNAAVVETLVRLSDSVDTQNRYGQSALHIAANMNALVHSSCIQPASFIPGLLQGSTHKGGLLSAYPRWTFSGESGHRPAARGALERTHKKGPNYDLYWLALN